MSTTTTTGTGSRHETVTRFLAALAGPRDDGEFLELRYRLDDGQRMGQLFDHPTRLRGLATRAVALGRRTDVYVGCAPRTRRHGGRDAVQHAFVLWVDCDGEHAVAALADFEPRPSIVIASGIGSDCHAYWPLIEPLARDDVERANRRLAHALGAQEITTLAATHEELLKDVLGNATTVIAHRQGVPDSAQLIADFAGTEGTWVSTRRTHHIGDTEHGTRSRAYQYVLHPDRLKRLTTAQAAVIVPGQRTATIAQIFHDPMLAQEPRYHPELIDVDGRWAGSIAEGPSDAGAE
jgi:hypothetical protein